MTDLSRPERATACFELNGQPCTVSAPLGELTALLLGPLNALPVAPLGTSAPVGMEPPKPLLGALVAPETPPAAATGTTDQIPF